MHIKFVTFHNFGPHAHFETAFKRGSIGIFGSNGKGKTHLVNGVYAALTNDFSRFDGVKADRIYDRAGPKEESFIEIVAEHEGTEFTIQRFLRPNKSELKIKGESKPIRSATEIEARLRKDLGVDMKLVDTYVFVDQWKMFSFLSHTPKERSEAFKYLCNTQKADVIFDACAELTSGSELTADVLDNSDELVTEIGDLETTIESLETERGVFEENLLNSKSLSTAQQLIKKRERHVELQSDLKECQAKLTEREDKFNKKSAALLKKRKSVETHRKTVDELTTAAESAKIALSSWSQYDKRRKRKAVLVAMTSAYIDEAAEHPEPEKPKRFDKLAEMRDDLNDLQARFDIAEEVTDALDGLDVDDDTTVVECPTCHQAVSVEFIQAQQRLLNELEEQISPLVIRVKAVEQYNRDIAAWNTWKAGFDARKQATENELLEFKGLKEPAGDKDKLQQSVNLYDAGVVTLENLEKEAREKEKEVTQYETRVAETRDHIVRINERLLKTTVDDKKFAKANKRLDEHREAELKISAIDGQLEEARRSLKAAKKNLDQLRAVIARKAKRQIVLKLLSRVKEIFHWGKLPKLVAEGNLVNMEADINASLELFGSPFWADADENLGFKVHFPGRPAHRAEGLSGGQKGVFAVAFRMAINSLFGADIGMLWLDEPTAGLDEDNVSYLEGALTHLSAEVRDKRQIVVITHADQLRTAFDQVIEL